MHGLVHGAHPTFSQEAHDLVAAERRADRELFRPGHRRWNGLGAALSLVVGRHGASWSAIVPASTGPVNDGRPVRSFSIELRVRAELSHVRVA
jgi:hypothetical protein